MRRHSLFLFLLAVAALAEDHGPAARLSGAPGELVCTACHAGTALNGGGSVAIQLPGGATYTPGVKQQLKIQLTDASARRYGFQLGAALLHLRLKHDLSIG
jgi:hypothetical protein